MLGEPGSKWPRICQKSRSGRPSESTQEALNSLLTCWLGCFQRFLRISTKIPPGGPTRGPPLTPCGPMPPCWRFGWPLALPTNMMHATNMHPPSLCLPKMGGSLGSILAMRTGAIVDLTVGPILEKLTFRARFFRIGRTSQNHRFEVIRPSFCYLRPLLGLPLIHI